MLLNLFDQHTNLCSNITKIFFLYNFINYACMCILIDWIVSTVSKSWGSYVDNIRKESLVTTNMRFVVKTYTASSKEKITLWKVEKEGT